MRFSLRLSQALVLAEVVTLGVFAVLLYQVPTCRGAVGCYLTVGTSPQVSTSNGTGVYVANNGSSNVSLIDTDTNSVMQTISVGSAPQAAISSGTGVYIANGSSNTVTVIDAVRRTTKSVSVGTNPYAFAVSGTGVYVVNRSSNTVSIIDSRTNTVVATISVGTGPDAIVASGTGVYVGNESSSNVSVIDIRRRTVKTVSVSSTPVAMATTGTGVYVVLSNGNGVAIIDTRTDTVSKTVSLGGGNFPLTIAISGTGVYVGNYDGGSLSVINTNGNVLLTTIATASRPYAVAVSGTGVYVSNSNAGTISLVNTRTLTKIRDIATGSTPRGITILGTTAYVANRGSNSVMVLDTNAGNYIAACIASTCGNSAITGHEACDDGNTTSGDGCSSTCAVEDSWQCSGTPSTCSATASVCSADTYFPFDSTGSLTVSGTFSVSTDVPSAEPTGGRSLVFNGTNSYVQTTNSFSGDFSICAWISTTAVGNGTAHYLSMPIVDAEVGGIADDMGFGVDSNGKLVYGGSDQAAGWDYVVNGATSVNTGNWVHACVTRRQANGEIKLYVNGSLDAADYGSTTAPSDNTNLRIGYGYDGAKYWNGKLDEVRFYQHVLSSAEISSLKNGGCVTSSSSSSSAGGGGAAWLTQLRLQNNLTSNGAAASAASASASSVSSLAVSSSASSSVASSLVSSASSANHSAAPVRFAPSSSPAVVLTPAKAQLRTRTCKRVEKWFHASTGVLARLNVRLLKTFGFECDM